MSRPRVLLNALSVTAGGGRSYALNVARELARDDRGFDVTIWAPPGALDGIDLGRVALQVARLPMAPGSLRLAGRLVREAAVLPLRAARFDLLYCMADLAPPWALAPTVVALRNLNIYERRFYDTVRLRWLERLARLGLSRARRVVFPSHAAARQIGGRLGISPQRIAVVPHGIDPDAFVSCDSPPASEPYLFLPAAVERHKNLGVLIESLGYVRNRRIQAWIAGPEQSDPRYAETLRRQVARLGLQSRVRFLGALPYERILGYYRGALAFVFPSLLETFGHPLLEAMLAEVPIVSADLPVCREIAADAALYFAPDDPRSLAGAIDRIEEQTDETRQRVARGRERVEQFSWRRSVDALCDVFEAALTG